jgi:hypothetical protein
MLQPLVGSNSSRCLQKEKMQLSTLFSNSGEKDIPEAIY